MCALNSSGDSPAPVFEGEAKAKEIAVQKLMKQLAEQWQRSDRRQTGITILPKLFAVIRVGRYAKRFSKIQDSALCDFCQLSPQFSLLLRS